MLEELVMEIHGREKNMSATGGYSKYRFYGHYWGVDLVESVQFRVAFVFMCCCYYSVLH